MADSYEDTSYNGTSSISYYEPVDPLTVFWLPMSVFTILFIVGVPANIIVLTVLLRSYRSLTVTSMYLINMAVVDLLLLLTQIPSKLNMTWATQEGNQMIWEPPLVICQINTYLNYINITVSISTLTAMSVSRYCAVTYPVGTRTNDPRRRTIITIIIIWIMCLFVSLPGYLTATHFQDTFLCAQRWRKRLMRNLYNAMVTVVFYIIPLIIIGMCYLLMAKVLWKSDNELANLSAPGGASRKHSRRKVARMVLILVVCFAVCWLPYHTRMFLEDYADIAGSDLYYIFNLMSRWMAYLNSALNPLLYSFLAENFRAQLRELCPCCKKTPEHGTPQSRASAQTMLEVRSSISPHHSPAKMRVIYPRKSYGSGSNVPAHV